jgi:hypothetical protein
MWLPRIFRLTLRKIRDKTNTLSSLLVSHEKNVKNNKRTHLSGIEYPKCKYKALIELSSRNKSLLEDLFYIFDVGRCGVVNQISLILFPTTKDLRLAISFFV